jgi:hypothetical protein
LQCKKAVQLGMSAEADIDALVSLHERT